MYEVRRMIYTIYNAIGEEPEAWRDGKPLCKIFTEIPLEYEPYTGVFWPWRESDDAVCQGYCRRFPFRVLRLAEVRAIADNLVNREFEEHGPRAILLTDITYIPLNGGHCYLSTILDAYTKQVLSYVLSESLEVDFVLETVNKLVAEHGVSLNRKTIIHSDQGCHYTCIKFIQLVKSSSLRQSMSRRGNCWDNAPQESFFGHMKDELAAEIPTWTTFEDVCRSIDDWMEYYNNDRCQWDLAKLSPNEYYDYITTGAYPPHMLPPVNGSA
ncbi:MAG: IS3 family transposase [Ruminococcaceae bacterium]|nr:IS3 family transposase [Oscillospiraceae bacterium]